MVNWNIDGLNEKYLTTRTAYMMNYLKKIKPSVLFLQEVREDKLEIYKGLRSNYHFIEPVENPQAIYYPARPTKIAGMEYFNCVFLRKDTISVDKASNHSIYIRIVSSNHNKGISEKV